MYKQLKERLTALRGEHAELEARVTSLGTSLVILSLLQGLVYISYKHVTIDHQCYQLKGLAASDQEFFYDELFEVGRCTLYSPDDHAPLFRLSRGDVNKFDAYMERGYDVSCSGGSYLYFFSSISCDVRLVRGEAPRVRFRHWRLWR